MLVACLPYRKAVAMLNNDDVDVTIHDEGYGLGGVVPAHEAVYGEFREPSLGGGCVREWMQGGFVVNGLSDLEIAVSCAASGLHTIVGDSDNGRLFAQNVGAIRRSYIALDDDVKAVDCLFRGDIPDVVEIYHDDHVLKVLGGAGSDLKPGDFTRAHLGVLFMDDLDGFDRKIVRALRQPMSDGRVDLARGRIRACLPADFSLVATVGDERGWMPETVGIVNMCHMRLNGFDWSRFRLDKCLFIDACEGSVGCNKDGLLRLNDVGTNMHILRFGLFRRLCDLIALVTGVGVVNSDVVGCAARLFSGLPMRLG